MAMNSVGMRPQSLTMPEREKAQKKAGGKEKAPPSMKSLIAAEIGDKFRFNPAGEAVKVNKGDDSDYWKALGYYA